MPLKLIVLSAVLISIAGISISFKKRTLVAASVYAKQIAILNDKLDAFNAATRDKSPLQKLRKSFVEARIAYKTASIISDYFFPALFRRINGPDLKFAEEDNPDDIRNPHGFQVMERMLYGEGDSVNYAGLLNEVTLLQDAFNSIVPMADQENMFSDPLVFDAMRMATIRLISMGITGFDSPVAQNSLEEANGVLVGMQQILTAFGEDDCAAIAQRAVASLHQHTDFNAFDRLRFIREYGDPLYAALTDASKLPGRVMPEERRPINLSARSIFSKHFFDINFFSPNSRYLPTPERVLLGKQLFYDSILSISRKRSCAGCHNPSKAFADGMRTPSSLTKTGTITRNTPTLLNAAWQTRFFYDSRTATLENQLSSVVHNTDEMEGSLKEAIKRIRQHPRYNNQFKNAYPGANDAITEYNIANAISSYVRSLTDYNSRFDKYMRGEGELSKSEKAGFNLFAGKAKCATCHYVPLFNGLVPPEFTETESEVIGVPAVSKKTFDGDAGKYLFTRSAIHRNAFKTPTIRNIALTAPYMHNGVFETLEEVMDFYNKGGGAGTHTAPENQTLPAEKLRLSKKEIKNIIAFMKALTDENGMQR